MSGRSTRSLRAAHSGPMHYNPEGKGTAAYRSKDFLCYGSDEGYHLHLWAVTHPFKGSTLRLFPHYEGGSVSGILRFSNSRGECFNECTIASRKDQSVALDLDSFLECCETDSGFRHAHLEVITESLCSGHIQVATATRSVIMPPLHCVSDLVARALPLSFSDHMQHVVALTNPSDRQVSVRCRMFVATRTPEEACLLPPNGVLLVSPEVMFRSVFDEIDLSEEELGYLRFSTRSEQPIGVQLLEEMTFSAGERVLGVVE